MIRKNHRQVHERLKERFGNDPRFPALIAGGSVAKGMARDDSDVDVVFVVSEEEWERRKGERDYFIYLTDLCDYEGGYVDGKTVPYEFLLDAAERGSEPTRFSFVDSFVLYSRLPGLEDLLERIRVYPEHERREKIEAFYSQVVLLSNFFVAEAEKWGNPYLLAQSSANLVLFGGRLILAYNKILFPSHKWLLRAVEKAKEKPESFMKLAHELLERPCKETAKAFGECITKFRDWGLTFDQAVSRYIEDAEWNWREGRPPLQDW